MRRRARVFDVTPNPPGHDKHSCDADEKVEAVKPRLQRVVLVPLLTKLLAHIRKPQTPRQRSRKSVDYETSEIHSRYACRKRNERSNRRQQPAHKHNRLAILRKPTIGDIEIVSREQNIAPILLDERSPAIHSHPVGHKRTEHAANVA